MSDVLKTILIEGKNGPVRINESDFIVDEHKMYAPKKNDEPIIEGMTATTIIPAPGNISVPPAASTPAQFATPEAQPDLNVQLAPGAFTPPAPEQVTAQTFTATAEQRLVSKQGKKYFIVNAAGEKIEAEGINKDGYATEQDAWAAAVPGLAGTNIPAA